MAQTESFRNRLSPQSLAYLAILISVLYWIYLYFATKMVVIYDAANYLSLAQLINDRGWSEFFRQGPQREPLFPFILSMSIRLATFASANYLKVQTAVNILFLLATQLLILRVLREMRINGYISATAIFYFGISPAIINSAFSLWSEIVTLPFVLLIAYAGAKLWIAMRRGSRVGIPWALALSLTFIVISLAKAIFEFVFYVFSIPFLLLLFYSSMKKWKGIIVVSISSLLILFAGYLAFLQGFKSLNQNFNGHYVLAGRGPFIIYGSAVKRTKDLDHRMFWAGVASIPGEGVCRKMFSNEECDYWTELSQDQFGLSRLDTLKAQGLQGNDLDRTMMQEATRIILKKPGKYLWWFILEGFKMFFWESTQFGFVEYPATLQRIYDNTLFKNGLRLVLFLFTALGFTTAVVEVVRNRKRLLEPGSDGFSLLFLFLSVIAIAAFVFFYSFSTIHTRYAAPLAPLFLIFVAYTADRWLRYRSRADTAQNE
jgi:hypothetical protein